MTKIIKRMKSYDQLHQNKGIKSNFAVLNPNLMAGMGQPAAILFEKALSTPDVDPSIFQRNATPSS